jgi:hypothetical protein
VGKTGDKGLASGTHGRREFVRVLFALYRNQHSGILDIQFGKKSRKLFFLGGNPIAYRSDLPEEDIGRTLANANLLPEKQINYFREKLSEGEQLEQAIIMSGALTGKQIADHKQSRMHSNIGSPLLWGSGTWTFQPRPNTQVGRIDPALRPDANALAALWQAVQQHVSMDAVFPSVTDPKAGAVALDPLCGALFSSFAVDAPFDALPEAISNGCSVEEIFRKLPDSSGNLVKLLWTLDSTGLIHREGRPHDTSIADQIQAAYEAPPPKPSAKRSKDATPKKDAGSNKASGPKKGEAPGQRKKRPPLTDDQLRAAHRKRIGRDFYAFLGVPPGAPTHAIDRKCKGLARRWRTPGKQREIPADVAEKVNELLAGVQLVWRTLTDEKHRAEYDKRHEQGRAPKVGDLRATSNPPTPEKAQQKVSESLDSGHIRARELMNSRKYKEALSLLKKIRVNDPSSPDVMADLGWATWKLHGAKNGDAEEFLRLALTFDDRHLFGLEYLAKVLVEKGDTDTAQVLVQRLLKLNPASTWAKKANKNLSGDA